MKLLHTARSIDEIGPILDVIRGRAFEPSAVRSHDEDREASLYVDVPILDRPVPPRWEHDPEFRKDFVLRFRFVDSVHVSDRLKSPRYDLEDIRWAAGDDAWVLHGRPWLEIYLPANRQQCELRTA